MKRAEVEKRYKSMGLDTEYGQDKPGTVYKPHKHEQTYLYTLSGSLKIRTDSGDWRTISTGQEFIIESGQLHEAIVGEDGWEYVAAWDEEESKTFADDH